MMNIRKENKKLFLDDISIEFHSDIDTVLQFPQYCVILLMDDDVPDNNVTAIDYAGKSIWNISEIIEFEYPEAYVAISKESPNTFSTVTYNGVKFIIDTVSNQIINKEITK
jgi:hypothetical protein